MSADDFRCPHCGQFNLPAWARTMEQRVAAAADGMRDQDVLSVKAAAAALSVSETTVRKLVATGELPAFKLGADTKIRRAALDDWVRQKEREQWPDPQSHPPDSPFREGKTRGRPTKVRMVP